MVKLAKEEEFLQLLIKSPEKVRAEDNSFYTDSDSSEIQDNVAPVQLPECLKTLHEK